MNPFFHFHRALAVLPLALLTSANAAFGAATDSPGLQKLEKEFGSTTLPILKEFCLGCHSTEKHKGDLDLERFKSFADIQKHPKIWQGVIEQISLNEMPPKDKPQPTTAQRDELLRWVGDALDEIAKTRAGDPGPVVLRRLSNAEYTYTLRDLTGVSSLDPAKEFPGDSASGEGFMNVGNSLVMSPSLVTKYLDAAKEVARHAVLLPDGIRFSANTSQRDWSEECLAAIRSFYARYSDSGGATSVNLQGIQFDTNAGGRLPLEKYLTATLAERESIRNGKKTLAQVAQERGLVTKYLALLWQALNGTEPSLLLDLVRNQWKTAAPADAPAIVRSIGEWQQALWRFTTVGHIGKRDGPKAWQIPVSPLASAREVRVKLNAPAHQKELSLYLSASDAGDGHEHDIAVWENPRLVVPGRPDLALRDLRAAAQVLTRDRESFFSTVTRCLAAAAEIHAATQKRPVEEYAAQHSVDPALLTAWLDALGIGSAAASIDSYLKSKMESAQGYDFIKGWTGADALGVLANSSTQHVRVPGNMKPQGIVVHPSPKLRVAVGWRSPVAAKIQIKGQVQHAHPECGNGVAWSLELRRGQTRQRLAAGTAQGAKAVPVGPLEPLPVQPGDLLSMVISPRDGNHSCDTTAVDFNLTDGSTVWDLGAEVSPNILAGNPHADSHGHDAVWHFYSEPDNGKGADSVLPTGSLLARWQTAADAETRNHLAVQVQQLLQSGASGVAKDSPDAQLYRQLTSLSGPLISVARKTLSTASNASDSAGPSASYGLDPALFGKHPTGGTVKPNSLAVQAPSVLELKLPADLVEGCEFVATAKLDTEHGQEGSVQMQALTTKPTVTSGLAAGAAKEQGAKGTWSEGDRPLVFDSPILVGEKSQTRERIERDFASFRSLFPIALCYTKIVPVDEVVTLTLYYREDEALRRLVLDETETAELDRLWDELHYVSHDALKLVDAFEQLWQFATQDADPSAFTPMREPIQKRAAEFKKWLVDTEPKHLEATLKFAESAFRRPLNDTEAKELRELYGKLRQQDLPHDEAIRFTLARLFVSPAFLYRTEKPGPGTESGPVDHQELATRLSYFLWASAPDAALLKVAAEKRLQSPDTLVAETHRMVKDPRIRRLATEFACAWLHLYEFDQLSEKSERHFPTFNGLRGAMYEETIRFFTDLFQRDGSVLEILDADHAFLNADLAKHYNIPAEKFGPGTDWRRVDGMKAYMRGGILGQATTLSKLSGASRTSPILRGNWVAEVLLGDKLPKPPKNVPQLPEDEATETLTMRQLTEKHSSDPKCIGCHRRIDPYGYSLEGFDTIGRRRDRDLGGRALDTSVKTMEGATFEGMEGLRAYLLNQRRDAFLKQFCRKLLGYSLGRGVMLSDNPLIAEMRQQLKDRQYRVSAALETIVRSRQFREIRGRDMAYEE